MFWNLIWKLTRYIKLIGCFFVGHDVRYGGGPSYDYEPERCYRCWFSEEEIDIHKPVILTRIYAWLVNREWRWFDALDLWLHDNHGKKLPSWWVY